MKIIQTWFTSKCECEHLLCTLCRISEKCIHFKFKSHNVKQQNLLHSCYRWAKPSSQYFVDFGCANSPEQTPCVFARQLCGRIRNRKMLPEPYATRQLEQSCWFSQNDTLSIECIEWCLLYDSTFWSYECSCLREYHQIQK